MKSILFSGIAVCLVPAAVLAATPEVPTPVLSRPDPVVVATNAPAVTNAAPAVTNAAPAGQSLSAPAPVSASKAAAKDPVAAELARMHAELDKIHTELRPADDFAASGRMLFPKDDFWSDATGGEVQWRHWVGPMVGLALSAGFQSWSLQEGQYIINPEHETHPTLIGSATVLPIGVSAVFRLPPSQSALRFSAEVGIRYLMISSDAMMAFDYPNMFAQQTYLETSVDLDNRAVGLAAVEIGGALGSGLEWFVSGGYQMDSGGGENWLFESIGNDFSGAVAGAGLRWTP